MLPVWKARCDHAELSDLLDGKRGEEELVDRIILPSSPSTTIDPRASEKTRYFVDFVLSHAPNDERPYLMLRVSGCEILGLLDSGASCTLVGAPGWEFLKSLGYKLNSRSVICTVANGGTCTAIGTVSVPFQLKHKVKLVEVLVVPSLSHTLILGIDFWMSMDLLPNLRDDVWHFSNCTPSVDVGTIESAETLSADQKLRVDQLITTQTALMGTSIGRTSLVEHIIETIPGVRPIKQRCYPVSPPKQKIIDDEIAKMLAGGLIEHSKSPWSSPVCLIPKKDKTYRFCVDYRQLNSVTRKDAYPLPLIAHILDQLSNAKFISSLDIKSAYWQVPIAESSRDYTAFCVSNGLYRFRVMPFGLTNAPATYQRLMDRVLGQDLNPYVFCYLDDIIIVTQDFEKHLEILETVFSRLHDAGLVVSLEKCKFCQSKVKYLGYVVDSNGLHPDPEKVQAIVNVASPQNVKDVRSFIGTASWYRRFVPQFASTLAPLTGLTKKDAKWNWTPECELAFRQVKDCLINAPVLQCPDFSRTFVLQTDASAFGVGAVLTQNFDDGERVICYLSRSLTATERKYSTTERECLAVIWAVEKLRHYLEGFHFKVITDHHSLLWLHRLKDPQGRLARWALRLQPYDYEILHRKGKEHIVPDFLSRSVPVVDIFNVVDHVDIVDVVPVQDKWYLALRNKVLKMPKRYPVWRIDENNRLLKYTKPRYPSLTAESSCWKLVVPEEQRTAIIRAKHDHPTCGHAGVFKTTARIFETHYWPKMRTDVARFVRRCSVCLSVKPEQKAPAGLMLSKTTALTKPWQTISIDLMGPLPRSTKGFKYILAISDLFSKFVLVYPLRTATASVVTKLVEEQVILTFGAPAAVVSDNGVQFKSKIFQSMLAQYSVKLSFTANYHAQANPVERVNRVLKTMLRSYVTDNHRTWDKYLPHIGYAMRSAKHEVTGYTPNFLMFGRELPLNNEDEVDTKEIRFVRAPLSSAREVELRQLYADVRKRLHEAYERSRHQYNLRRRDVRYALGQKVWKRNYVLSNAANFFAAKLAPRFAGPFIVSHIVSPWTYRLVDDCGRDLGIWHAKDLKAHPPDEEEVPDGLPV
jgi:transposase InsO family protein